MPRAARVALLALLLAPPALPADAGAQRDSVLALREARQAQARFEATRRRLLTITDGWGGGRCDERIGRFCVNHTKEEETEDAPEPERIGEERDEMLERLAEVARRIPGDRWVSGQRVRYLVEGRRFADAAAAAAECRAEGWWCAALAGLAAHFGSRPGPADSAFSEMLRLMPAEERERWLDAAHVLEPQLLRWLRRLPPAEREAAERRYWALADPFFARPGNEIRSEHLARNLMDSLQDRAETTDNLSWGGDLREILVRYGWPTGWSRTRQPGLIYATEMGYTSRMAGSDQLLLPPPEIFLDSLGIVAGEWDPELDAPRASYGLPMGDSLVKWHYPVPHQMAVFHRGDSAVIVAAWELPPDSVPADHPMEAALAATGDGLAMDAVARLAPAGPSGVLTAALPPRPVLASLELIQEGARRAGRVRRGLPVSPLPDSGIALSDVLLLREGGALPESLAEATRLARGSTEVRAGENIPVYWEVYGLDRVGATELTVSLSVVGGGRGWLRRIAERARIVSRGEPARLRWEESQMAGPVFGRALALQIPDLSPGDYAVEVEVTVAGQPPATARQRITVVDEEAAD